ncbi:hypothetical protein AMK26_26060 [Streptomyces sp. CB03234]|uniref:hypothetical protein n=1 Tax=Streptomyces sp. (strain CB03234) TaxID=1703937 RepID=UPI00093FC12C|nr:hypothetical protein [Streptomyces sp. CB03234]OKJ99503.1 hypothetical protein AMK26_26060 [Streptomyces sp. CB03234]
MSDALALGMLVSADKDRSQARQTRLARRRRAPAVGHRGPLLRPHGAQDHTGLLAYRLVRVAIGGGRGDAAEATPAIPNPVYYLMLAALAVLISTNARTKIVRVWGVR